MSDDKMKDRVNNNVDNCVDNSVNKASSRYAIHSGHTEEVVASVKDYLLQHPAQYCGDVESLLEMIFQNF